MTALTATRKTICWPRKAFHAGAIGATGLVVSFAGLDRLLMLQLAGISAVLYVGLDALRLACPELNRVALRVFAKILRKHERRCLSSGAWFLPAAFLTLLLAPRLIAGLAFLYLALGDPVASWVGVRFGRVRLPGGKTLEGSLAFVLTCLLVGSLFLGVTGAVPLAAAPVVALGGAVAAAIAEWLPVPHVDDNMRVPLAAAAGLSATAAVFAQTVSA